MDREKILVLGGAKSGKTDFALELGETIGSRIGKKGLYIATAQALDEEMEERISRHRRTRSSFWCTLEEPFEIWQAIVGADTDTGVILVDCLTLWLANVLASPLLDLEGCLDQLLEALRKQERCVIMVSNEVGMGIVPANREARRFRDAAGELHQRIAEQSDKVFFVLAGVAMEIKGNRWQLQDGRSKIGSNFS